MFKSLKSLFTPEPPKPVVPEVLNLTIGRGAEIDPLMLRLRDSASVFSLPSPTLIFTAQGVCRLQDGQWVHRLYTDDNVMLQVVSGQWEGDDAIRDVTLFVPYLSEHPQNAKAVKSWEERLTRPELTTPKGDTFDRLWFDPAEGPQDPVVLIEDIYDERTQTTPPRQIRQTCMLYHRAYGSGDRDLLLAIIEDYGDEISVEMMAGIPLEAHHLKV